MKKVFEKFDDDSKVIISELVKENKKISTLIQKLQRAKDKVNNQAETSRIINQQIER
jgi:hypothetical protein